MYHLHAHRVPSKSPWEEARQGNVEQGGFYEPGTARVTSDLIPSPLGSVTWLQRSSRSLEKPVRLCNQGSCGTGFADTKSCPRRSNSPLVTLQGLARIPGRPGSTMFLRIHLGDSGKAIWVRIRVPSLTVCINPGRFLVCHGRVNSRLSLRFD